MPPDIRRESKGYAVTALRHSGNLPSFTRDLIEASVFLADGMADEGRRLLLPIIKREPENAWAWAMMGEIEWHLNPFEGRSSQDAEPYLRKALELNDEFQEAKRHLIHIAIERHEFDLAADLARDLGPDFDDQFELDFVTAADDTRRRMLADSITSVESRG